MEYVSLIQENIQISQHGLHPSLTLQYTPKHMIKITECEASCGRRNQYNEDDFSF